MTSAGPDITVEVEPLFLPTRHGELFLLNYSARASRPSRYLLIAPPFAEEMNKSRRMIALLARQVAALGIGVLSIDLTGTGESLGDFGAASYDSWLADLTAAKTWLEQRDAQVTSLLGIRFGALLAAEFSRECSSCEQLVLWQPALSGKSMMAQFLRLRVAADMMTKADNRISVADLIGELENNRSVEVAGYEISPRLYTAICNRQLPDLIDSGSPPINWFQISMLADNVLTPADQRAIDALTSRGIAVQSAAIAGETFWNTTEITICEPLLEATARTLSH